MDCICSYPQSAAALQSRQQSASFILAGIGTGPERNLFEPKTKTPAQVGAMRKTVQTNTGGRSRICNFLIRSGPLSPFFRRILALRGTRRDRDRQWIRYRIRYDRRPSAGRTYLSMIIVAGSAPLARLSRRRERSPERAPGAGESKIPKSPYR